MSDKRSLMQRIVNEAATLVTPLVPGYLLTIAGDDDLVDEALHDNVAMTIGSRRRVVASAIADQRRRGNAPCSLLASFEAPRWQRAEDAQIGFQPRPDRLLMTADLAIELGQAVRFQFGVQNLEAVGGRHRRQETAAAILDKVFNLATE